VSAEPEDGCERSKRRHDTTDRQPPQELEITAQLGGGSRESRRLRRGRRLL
jgi:hypothetical protein